MFKRFIMMLLRPVLSELIKEEVLRMITVEPIKLDLKKVVISQSNEKTDIFVSRMLNYEYKLDLDYTALTNDRIDLGQSIKFASFAELYTTFDELSEDWDDDIVGFKEIKVACWYSYKGERQLQYLYLTGVGDSSMYAPKEFKKCKKPLTEIAKKFPELLI